jgi:hypothetical protein
MTLTENRINHTSKPVNNLLHNIKIKFMCVLYLGLFQGIESEVKLTQIINVIYYLLT